MIKMRVLSMAIAATLGLGSTAALAAQAQKATEIKPIVNASEGTELPQTWRPKCGSKTCDIGL